MTREHIQIRLLAALLAFSLAPAFAERTAEPPARPAIDLRALAKSVLLDVTYAGERLVAVGERGIVLLSDDGGKSWRQAKVPVSVTLTRVRFSDGRTGWAVGHYGSVLRSSDGGETWERQLDGATAAQLVLTSAQSDARAAPNDAAVKRRLIEAERLVRDGPDKPFFDLHFFDDRHGLVIGAYNLMFMTGDGGKTWRPLLDRLDNPKNLHLYAIAGLGDVLYVAGEQGLFLRSRDRGRTFARLATPYAGSYFSTVLKPSGEILLAGLRGNAYRSSDQGATWEKVDGVPPISFTAAALLQKETLLLANHAGQLFMDRKGSFEQLPLSPLPPFAAMLPLRDGTLLGVGVRGVTPLAAFGKAGK